MKRRSLCLIVLAGLVFAVLGFTPSALAKPIKVSTDPWSGAGIMYLAEAKGFFTEVQLEVKIVYFDSYFATIEAFNKGTIDTVQEALNDSIIAAANGTQFVSPIVTVHNTGFDAIIVNPEKIKTLTDLKGKKIGFVKGQMGHYMLWKALEKVGLTEADVIGVPLSFEEVKVAFEAGKIDGGCVNIFNESKKGQRIISSGDVPGSIDTLMMQAAFVRSNPEQVKALIKAWFKAVDYYAKNPEESIKIMANGLNMTEADFKNALSWAPIMLPEKMAEYYTVNNKEGLIAQTARDLHQFYQKINFYAPEQRKNADALMTQLDAYFDPAYLKDLGMIK